MFPAMLCLLLAMTLAAASAEFFKHYTHQQPSISTLYAQDKKSDQITQQCLHEMYPKNLYSYPLQIDQNDIPCIIHCVLKKFGIMSTDGMINLRQYYRRVEAIHKYDTRVLISDVGDICASQINGLNLDHDVCKKAKAFNDCTQLYAVSFAT